jgi:hypothetical protein
MLSFPLAPTTIIVPLACGLLLFLQVVKLGGDDV